RVLDDDETPDGRPFLVMEYLEGVTLEARVKTAGGTLSCADALPISSEVLDVLSAAHARGVVHGEVTPANLFLTDDGRVRVLEFGMANVWQVMQGRGPRTPPDPRSDIWDVGATMYQCLTGRSPREQDGGEAGPGIEIATLIAEMSAAIPAGVVRVVENAMAPAPEDRWPTTSAMRAAISVALNGSDANAPLWPQP